MMYTDLSMLEAKVPAQFSGTEGFSARRDNITYAETAGEREGKADFGSE